MAMKCISPCINWAVVTLSGGLYLSSLAIQGNKQFSYNGLTIGTPSKRLKLQSSVYEVNSKDNKNGINRVNTQFIRTIYDYYKRHNIPN